MQVLNYFLFKFICCIPFILLNNYDYLLLIFYLWSLLKCIQKLKRWSNHRVRRMVFRTGNYHIESNADRYHYRALIHFTQSLANPKWFQAGLIDNFASIVFSFTSRECFWTIAFQISSGSFCFPHGDVFLLLWTA